MELRQLLTDLGLRAAYPFPVDAVEVRQTHISAVFLAGAFAYKIRKPVKLPFLDFSTLEQRRHDCEEEVRLNRRLAADVYLGVFPISAASCGLKMEGRGEPVEWAVKMARLPDDATLEQWLARHRSRSRRTSGHDPKSGGFGDELVTALAQRLTAFHAAAETSAHIAQFGRFDAVARNIRENLAQAAPEIGVTLSRPVFDRLRALTDAALEQQRPLIESRAARGIPRDTHGDLHLEHVYFFDKPQTRLLRETGFVVVDCIEFNERFRFADPIADMAFLTMDLLFHGWDDLAAAFADAYFAASGDAEGRALLPLYVAYRAAVRGKVEGMKLEEPEIPATEQAVAQMRARAHWLLALRTLEAPSRRPCLVLVGGLPGTGKSTLARALADRAGFEVIRSDVVRKELARNAGAGEDLYTAEWTEHTYAECLRRAESVLWTGGRVLIDANFRQEAQRRLFLDVARRWCLPALVFLCHARPEVIRQRLSERRGDVSDADWAVYQQLAPSWEEPGPETIGCTHIVDTSGDAAPSRELVIAALKSKELFG